MHITEEALATALQNKFVVTRSTTNDVDPPVKTGSTSDLNNAGYWQSTFPDLNNASNNFGYIKTGQSGISTWEEALKSI